jgi:hypothetical protein
VPRLSETPADPWPWKMEAGLWYGALESGGEVYGVIRRIADIAGVRYEVLDRRYTMEWIPDREGAGRFTGIGGVTDAEPVSVEEGERLLAELLAIGPIGPPDLTR